jgi:hypothetical protein
VSHGLLKDTRVLFDLSRSESTAFCIGYLVALISADGNKLLVKHVSLLPALLSTSHLAWDIQDEIKDRKMYAGCYRNWSSSLISSQSVVPTINCHVICTRLLIITLCTAWKLLRSPSYAKIKLLATQKTSAYTVAADKVTNITVF